jgi:cell wall-associated NlpC family hydrolase
VSSAGRIKLGAVLAVVVTSGALAPAAAVGALRHHHHAPSAAQLAQSKREVAAREHQVRVLAHKVGVAQASLQQLNVQAEVAFEAYNEAKVKLATARRAVHTAHVVLTGANVQVAKGQRRATNFAKAAYESGGLSRLSAYLKPGGAAQLVSRVGAIDAISSSEHATLERLQAAQIYQRVVSNQAEAVQGKASRAAAVATRAKTVAQAAVARQTSVLAGLHHQQARLRNLLASAKSQASALEQAHLAALARARRRAAQQATPTPPSHSPYSGSSGSTAGTVSATTALAAVHDAESQIGKPYEWGAAGPSTYDCSGLVMWAYAQVGVHLDHWTGDQWNEGAHVSRTELQPGDLVFFAYNTSDPSTIHHVGLYVGNGQMVDAPYTGVDVRYDSAFRSDYIGAVRPYQR